jgi:hypothetical protein
MKTQVNKSRLMKRAWTIYKGVNPYSYSFSVALRRAWEVERATLEYEVRVARKAAIEAENAAARAKQTSVTNVSWMAGAAAYYSNARPGQYFGD